MHGMKTFAFAAAILGLTSLTGCPAEEPEDFGTIRIEIAPQNGDTTMFDGTVEVVATVQYETCLRKFYLERNVSYQQTGPEGAAVFEEWADRLCAYDGIVDCEVEEIEQILLEVNDAYNLSVSFKINDPSTLAYRELHVGPIPTEEFAACQDGLRPRVELRQAGLIGRDSEGSKLWDIATLPGQNVAVVGQGAPLRVTVSAD